MAVTVTFDVFCPFVKDIVVDDEYGSSVVAIQRSRVLSFSPEILKQNSKLYNFSDCLRHRSIFRFCPRTQYRVLLIWFPQDQSSANTHTIARHTASDVRIRFPIRIHKSIQLQIRRSRIEKAMTYRAFHVMQYLVSCLKVRGSWMRQTNKVCGQQTWW